MNEQKNNNARFVGLIMAVLVPGAPQILTGYWKTGIAWYISSWVVFYLCASVLLTPSSLSFTMIIAIETFAFIYLVILFLYSYRPTQKLGCSGCIMFIMFTVIINNTTNIFLQCFIDLSTDNIKRFVGSSMYPTIRTMPSHFPDITIEHKLSGSPRRGDIVSFIYETDLKPFGKRIVGLPGETIYIKTPYVFVNGKKLLDPPIFKTISSREQGYSGFIDLEYLGDEDLGITLPITLGPDEYFVLGDNSTHSADSRYFGPVPREKILDKIVRIVFPPWRIREL